MNRTWTSLLLTVVLGTVLTGCWSRKELNELAITAAIGIDKAGSDYVVSVQVVNPGEIAKKSAGGGSSPIVTYTMKGKTVFQAIRRMTTESPRRIYGSHLRIIVFGENLAREGIAPAVDLLVSDQEVRGDFFIVLAKGAPVSQILSTFTTLEKIPANHLFTSLDKSEQSWAATGKTTMDQLVSDITSKGKDPILTGITIVGDQAAGNQKENTSNARNSAVLRYSGMAAFHQDKLAGWLNENESKGYNYTMGHVKGTVVNIACPDEDNRMMGVQVIRTRQSTKSILVNGKPTIDFHLKGEAIIGESGCSADLSLPETVREVEAKTDADIQSKIEESLNIAMKRYQSDIFGFGDVIHRAQPKVWKRVMNDWDQELSGLPVHVTVSIKIRRQGTTIHSVEEQIKK